MEEMKLIISDFIGENWEAFKQRCEERGLTNDIEIEEQLDELLAD